MPYGCLCVGVFGIPCFLSMNWIDRTSVQARISIDHAQDRAAVSGVEEVTFSGARTEAGGGEAPGR